MEEAVTSESRLDQARNNFKLAEQSKSILLYGRLITLIDIEWFWKTWS